jgi:hypothetical protein
MVPIGQNRICDQYGNVKAYVYAVIQQRSHYQISITGVQQEQAFHPSPEGTGGKKVVLGILWLESESPKIDWEERTVTLRN